MNNVLQDLNPITRTIENTVFLNVQNSTQILHVYNSYSKWQVWCAKSATKYEKSKIY
jgi:hypothetical protein